MIQKVIEKIFGSIMNVLANIRSIRIDIDAQYSKICGMHYEQ